MVTSTDAPTVVGLPPVLVPEPVNVWSPRVAFPMDMGIVNLKLQSCGPVVGVEADAASVHRDPLGLVVRPDEDDEGVEALHPARVPILQPERAGAGLSRQLGRGALVVGVGAARRSLHHVVLPGVPQAWARPSLTSLVMFFTSAVCWTLPLYSVLPSLAELHVVVKLVLIFTSNVIAEKIAAASSAPPTKSRLWPKVKEDRVRPVVVLILELAQVVVEERLRPVERLDQRL